MSYDKPTNKTFDTMFWQGNLFSILFPLEGEPAKYKATQYTYLKNDFKIRHPIMYWLVYKRWFSYYTRQFKPHFETVNHFGQSIPFDIETQHIAADTRFALYHPILFLIFAAGVLGYKILKKAFAAPVKIIQRIRKVQ